MNRGQTNIAQAILNSYAHQYLGIPHHQVMVAGAHNPEGWHLIIACDGGPKIAHDLDAAKAIIDGLNIPSPIQEQKP